MKTYYEPGRIIIAIKDAIWRHTYLKVALDLGELLLDGYAYYLVDETGESLADIKTRCEKNNACFNPDMLESVDLVREDYLKLYAFSNRDIFFKALDKNIRGKIFMREYMIKELNKPTK